MDMEFDIKGAIRTNLSRVFDTEDTYTPGDFAAELLDIVIEDLDFNGPTDFNMKVNEFVQKYEENDGYTELDLLNDVNNLMEGV